MNMFPHVPQVSPLHASLAPDTGWYPDLSVVLFRIVRLRSKLSGSGWGAGSNGAGSNKVIVGNVRVIVFDVL